MADQAISSLTASQESHTSILKTLNAQSIILPDLNALIDGWPKEVNPGVDQLRPELDAWLDA